MSHIFRFFGAKIRDGVWSLDDAEIEHAVKVLRLQSRMPVEVMDGAGCIVTGEVGRCSRDAVEVAVHTVDCFDPPEVKRGVAFGALKPGDVDDLLAELVELAVDEIHIFQQADTAKFRTGDKPRERWERIVRAAAKQSKRAFLPSLTVHENLKTAIQSLEPIFQTKLVLDPEGQVSLLKAVDRPLVSVVGLIGGERGLDSSELSMCQKNGYIPVKLGPYILRAKTAIVATAGAFAMTSP